MHLVIILEDDLKLGVLLQEMVNGVPGFRCEHVFANPVQFLKGNYPVDIILLDVSMPEMNGLDAIEPILKKYPDASIIMNTIRDDDETIFEAIKKGALGYMVKHAMNVSLAEVLNTVATGGAFMTPLIARKVFESFQSRKNSLAEVLTERELAIVKDIVDGLSYKLVAEHAGISLNTVRTHITRIYRKLKINSKAELFKLSGR
jgi:DNA-binding NarL/FixJ family response regulator